MEKRKPEAAKHHGMETCSELMHLANRLKELYDEILLIDNQGHLVKNGSDHQQHRITRAGRELWDQYEGIQNYMPFCFPYDVRDCLILIIQAHHFAEEMRLDLDESQKSHTYQHAETMLDRILARVLTGLSQLVEDKLCDLGLQGEDFLENIDSNKLAVSIGNEIKQRQFEEAEKAGIVDVAKADARAEMQGAPANGAAHNVDM